MSHNAAKEVIIGNFVIVYPFDNFGNLQSSRGTAENIKVLSDSSHVIIKLTMSITVFRNFHISNIM